jgi:hypothetical protein
LLTQIQQSLLDWAVACHRGGVRMAGCFLRTVSLHAKSMLESVENPNIRPCFYGVAVLRSGAEEYSFVLWRVCTSVIMWVLSFVAQAFQTFFGKFGNLPSPFKPIGLAFPFGTRSKIYGRKLLAQIQQSLFD